MSQPDLPIKKRRVPIEGPVEQRVALVDGNFDLPPEALAAMREVRGIVAEAAARIATSVSKCKHDKGRLIHTMDLLQNVKDTACVSLILPHASKEVDE